jgi:Ice-binding-like/Bacterial Ig-like domain
MRKGPVGITCLLATLLVAFMAGCGQEVATVPAVVSTIPANGATNVAVNTPISATFSIAMNPATLTAATFTVTGPGGAAVAGTVTYSGVTATFTPAAALAYGTIYTGTITTGATDLGGASMFGNYGWTFTTITPPPAVTATVPANGATGVPITQVISANFNEAMNCATLASPAATFTLTGPGATPVAGTVGCSGSIATFTPTADLAVNTVYTATITTGAQDLADTPLAGNYVWTFRTASAPPAPPTVISTVPISGAVGVPINQVLSATFSVAMIPATINAATFTLSSPGAVSVTGVVTYVPAGSVAIFKPTANLLPSTVYTATITTGATDLAGTALAQNYVWTFTTGAVPVVVPPTVISTIPINGATGVPLNQIVSATFSTAMNPATINSGTFTLTGPGSTAVSGLVAYAAIGNTLTFTPTANLAPNTLFTATITTGAQNLEGTALAANYVWTFTTGAAAATAAPELVSTVPANAATGVPLNQAVSATFSEAMNPLTITTATFQLTGPGGITVAGTVSYNAISFIATFTPTAPLTAGDTYTAIVTNGATDLTGNPLGNTGAPNPWMFSTGTVVVPPLVVLGPTISLFGGFAGTAGMTNTGTLTVINGDSGTTAVGFSSYTGFNDDSVVVAGIPQCQYTETPANIGLVTGTIYSPLVVPAPYVCPEGTAADIAIADEALAEANTAYTYLQGLPSTGVLAAELGSTTIYPGVYKNSSSVGITAGDLTLDAQGNPNATWVFQIGSTLTVGQAAIPRNVILANGAQAGNIYWAVATDVPHLEQSGGGTFNGTVIANGSAGIAVSTAENTTITTINGRLISLNASTTLVDTVINVPAP